MKPACWIIKSNRFGSVLGVDGKFYNMVSVDRIKEYKSEGWAARKLMRLGGRGNGDFTAYAVYAGDSIDCCGRITKGEELCVTK